MVIFMHTLNTSENRLQCLITKQNEKLNIKFDLSYVKKKKRKNSSDEIHQRVNSDCLWVVSLK